MTCKQDDEEAVALYDVESMAELDKVFFDHLDAELKKINHFYNNKEAEYVAQANRLEKQLLALFKVQEALARQNLKMQTFSFAKSPEHFSDDLSDAGELLKMFYVKVLYSKRLALNFHV